MNRRMLVFLVSSIYQNSYIAPLPACCMAAVSAVILHQFWREYNRTNRLASPSPGVHESEMQAVLAVEEMSADANAQDLAVSQSKASS